MSLKSLNQSINQSNQTSNDIDLKEADLSF